MKCSCCGHREMVAIHTGSVRKGGKAATTYACSWCDKPGGLAIDKARWHTPVGQKYPKLVSG